MNVMIKKCLRNFYIFIRNKKTEGKMSRQIDKRQWCTKEDFENNQHSNIINDIINHFRFKKFTQMNGIV